MPLHEYECPQCGYVEEVLESMSDEDDPVIRFCVCDGVMRKIMSAGAFILKGDGFYKPSVGG